MPRTGKHLSFVPGHRRDPKIDRALAKIDWIIKTGSRDELLALQVALADLVAKCDARVAELDSEEKGRLLQFRSRN